LRKFWRRCVKLIGIAFRRAVAFAGHGLEARTVEDRHLAALVRDHAGVHERTHDD
jgi:hypothetical protein